LLLLALEKQKLSLGNRTLEVPSEACAANEIRWDQSLGGGAARAGVARGGGGGTVVVAADQAGNADYAPATQVTQTMVVNQATPTNYSYTVGYDPVGNVANFNDSVMGTWSFNYDSLNRLMSGQNTAVTSTSTQYTGMNLCWAYDSFGNRIMQIFQSAACPAAPTPGQSPATVYYNPNNQVTFVSQSAPSVISAPNGFAYDGAGNVLQDNQNTYLYDAEGRICAVQSTPVEGFTSMTQYLYDADGTRVAKGTITNWSAGCDTTQNGFTMTASYILGPGNEQLAELSWSGGVPTPVHTNVWAGGQLTATYSYDDPINYPAGILYFPLTDWLGTRRMLADQYGNLAQTCDSLPFGDGESCPATPTEHLFTGKERDTESGNDYFGARYYSSAMGRFMSPDWSAKEEPVPYAKLDDPQTLNLYDYLRNNPLGGVDADGHDWMDALQYASGVAQGVESSLTGGLVGSPRASDSAASLSGQLTGSLAVTHISATALADSGIAAGGGLIAAPESGGTSLAVEPVAGAVALVSLATAAGGAKNVGAVALAMSAKKASSPNQMNQEVKRGQAPKDVKRVDGPHTDDGGQGQNHVHLTDGSAQNQDGTAHHGTPSPSNAVKDWLKSHGW
jgi:RHS repeat-associated protein